jgi:hypothetical protein
VSKNERQCGHTQDQQGYGQQTADNVPQHRLFSQNLKKKIRQTSGNARGGEYMPNLHLQIHPVFIPITSQVIIWDFRLRICGIATLYQLKSTEFLKSKIQIQKSKITPTCEEQKRA